MRYQTVTFKKVTFHNVVYNAVILDEDLKLTSFVNWMS